LDALGEKDPKNFRKDNQRSGPDIPGNPLYHQYLCVDDEEGLTCGSVRTEEGSPMGKGVPSDDKFVEERCTKVQNDHQCIQNCIKKKLRSKKRPYYTLFGPGTNCQEWTDNVLRKCRRKCK